MRYDADEPTDHDRDCDYPEAEITECRYCGKDHYNDEDCPDDDDEATR